MNAVLRKIDNCFSESKNDVDSCMSDVGMLDSLTPDRNNANLANIISDAAMRISFDSIAAQMTSKLSFSNESTIEDIEAIKHT